MNANGGNELPQTGSGSAQAGTEPADFKAASTEITQLSDELSRANAAYHNDDAPFISDVEYDTKKRRLEELEAASRVERQEKEALYGKAAPLVLELQQKLAESERATVRERHRSAKFEARVRDLQKAILDVTGRDVSRWACGFDSAIRAGICDEARRQVELRECPALHQV